MKTTNKRKEKPLSTTALLVFVMVLVISFCMSAFVSTDIVTNKFSASTLDIALIEAKYDKLTQQQKSTLIPNKRLDKDPKVMNTDTTDAFVFLKITVPVTSITNFDPTVPVNQATPVSYSEIKNYSYAGGVQTFTAVKAGYYKLEAWGAQGGSALHSLSLDKTDTNSQIDGGKGGYSSGVVYLNEGQEVYVCVGGQGESIKTSDYTADTTIAGGYNGGGAAYIYDAKDNCYIGSGGGATHFAINQNYGQLSSYKNHQDDLLLVAGGGGGSYYCYHESIKDYYNYGYGGCGGGENGGNGSIGDSNVGTNYSAFLMAGGGQSDMTANNDDNIRYGEFGQGVSAFLKRKPNGLVDDDIQFYDSGAGGGYYGGGKYNEGLTGGGGSGYCNKDILTNYSSIAGNQSFPDIDGNVETGHEGNGYARVTYLNSREQEVFYLKTSDKVQYATASYFNDHAQDASDKEYWIELPECEEGTDLSGKERTYVFGYSVYLKQDEVSETLFDYIQLKNIMQYEISPTKNLNIKVQAYGIQTDHLENIEKDYGGEKALMTQADLTKIYGLIVGNNG